MGGFETPRMSFFKILKIYNFYLIKEIVAFLAQLVERKALNLVVVGSSPTVGEFFILIIFVNNLEFIMFMPFKKILNFLRNKYRLSTLTILR